MEESANKFVKLLKNKMILKTAIAVVLLVVGVLFCAIPIKSLTLVKTIVIIIAFIIGSIGTIVYCIAPAVYRDYKWLGVGIFCILVGLLLVYVPASFVICLAGFMIILGAIDSWNAIKAIRASEKVDKFDIIGLVFGLIIAGLGVVSIILNSTKLAEHIVMIVIGALLILKAMFDLVMMFALKKELNTDVSESEEIQK